MYYAQVDTTPEGEPVLMGTFFVAHCPANVLFYTSASQTVMSKAFVEKHHIPVEELVNGVIIQSLGGRLYTK